MGEAGTSSLTPDVRSKVSMIKGLDPPPRRVLHRHGGHVALHKSSKRKSQLVICQGVIYVFGRPLVSGGISLLPRDPG